MIKISEIVNSNSKFKSTALLAVYVGLMVTAAIFFSKYVDRENLQEFIRQSGSMGIFLYFLIEVFYVTFTPLLNTFILVASGYLFGGHIGFLINFVSTTVGLFLIVFLVKKYGRPLLKRVISEKFYGRFDRTVEKIGPIALLIVYVLPFTPDDELTYMVAAGPISFNRFILPVVLGSIAKSAYSYIGDMGKEGVVIALYSRVVLLVVGLILISLQEYLIKKSPKVKSF